MSSDGLKYRLEPIRMLSGELRLRAVRLGAWYRITYPGGGWCHHRAETVQIDGAQPDAIHYTGTPIQASPNGNAEFHVEILLMRNGSLRIQVLTEGIEVDDPHGTIPSDARLDQVVQRSPIWWIPVV